MPQQLWVQDIYSLVLCKLRHIVVVLLGWINLVASKKHHKGDSFWHFGCMALAPLGSYWSLLMWIQQSSRSLSPGATTVPRGMEASLSCLLVPMQGLMHADSAHLDL